MLLPKDINPNNTLYLNGAYAIEAINTFENKLIDFFELYEKLNKKKEISFRMFIFTLDWLYLIGGIEHGEDGKIKRCF